MGVHFELENIICDMRPTTPDPIIRKKKGIKFPTYSDMIIVTSTIPGYVSRRDRVHGSWFIQDLCKVFMKNSHEQPLQKLLNKVSVLIMERESSDGGKQSMEYKVRYK